MTQEEKQLLLKDLCTRFPYGVKIIDEPAHCLGELFLISTTDMVEYETETDTGMQTICNIKPYLRPMSSITEEELEELLDGENSDFDGKSELVKRAMLAWANGDNLLSNALFSMQYAKTVDWLNAHHFDYRGLIEKGLALEATADMYKIE